MYKTLRFLDLGRCLGSLCLLAPVLAAAVMLSALGKAAEKEPKKDPTLEEALKFQAPKIHDFLWRHMKHPEQSLHVGVVKFLVQFDGQRCPSDNAGPLNWHIARRLEAALILTLPKEEEDTFRVLHIHDPSKELRSADHLSANGRKAFFQRDYPPAWGEEEKISAHVFLTGLVKVTDGARTLRVTVQAFDSTGKEPEEVCHFKVAAEPNLLTEAGVSYALSRGSNPEDIAKLMAAWKQPELPLEATAVVPKRGKGVKPKASAPEGPTVRELLQQAPIDLEILYKSKGEEKARKVAIEADGWLPEPGEGTEVSFRLKHRNTDKRTYGVVLKVNGENTIYPEEREPDDFRAHKWILDPKDDYRVKGYLKKNAKDTVKNFTVLPESESRLEEVNYGPHAGTFTVVIFLGRPDGKEQPDGKPSDVVLGAISRGVPDGLGRPNRLEALKGDLRKKAEQKQDSQNGMRRGIILAGPSTKQEVKDVDFYPYQTPVSVIQLRYYKPHTEE